MKLQGTNNLNPNFAAGGHNNWNARFAAIPEGDKLKDNEQMKEIFELILTASKANPHSAEKMAACVNNEETTIFLGIDAAEPENFILFHNIEVIPASRHQKKPIIRALHGFDEKATVVTLNFEKIANLYEIPCPSMTNIRKFMGFDKINTGLIPANKSSNLLKSRGIIALPPFISSKLMNLPILSVSNVLAIVLKTIEDYDRKMDEKIARATVDLSEENEKEEEEESKGEPPKEKKQNISSDELDDDPIDEEEEYDEDGAATSSKTKQANKETKIPRKAIKSSSFSNCESLLRFLWSAAWQLKFPNSSEDINGPKKPILPGTFAALTTDDSHLVWGKDRHTRNNVGQENSGGGTPAPSNQSPAQAANAESIHLARKTTTALESMSACFQVLQKTNASPTNQTEKVHAYNMRMIRRLCSTDGMTEREPTKFFIELSTSPGKGGTGAIIRWGLHMTLNTMNVQVSNGCIVAIARGVWCWTRQNYPNNLSIFGFPRVTANDYVKGVGDSSQNIHLRANCGSNLSEKDVKLLTHQGLSYTPDVGETIKQLRNFSKCLDSLIHPDSMMTVNLKGLIKMIEDNEESYEANQAMDSLFCLKLLYKVDLTRNRLFQACLINEDFIDVDWNMCDFYRIHTSVMDGNFIQLLPANLGIPDSSKDSSSKRGKSDHDDNSSVNHQPSKKKSKGVTPRIREGEAKGNQVINNDHNESLKLKQGENYGDLVMKKHQLQYTPKWPNSANTLCANYHIIGRCHNRCMRSESHAKMTPAVLQATETWLKKCRDDNE